MPEEPKASTLENVDPKLLEEFLKSYNKKPFKKTSNSDSLTFSEWESGPDLLRVYRGTYKGKEQLSIRKFYQEEGDPEWKFGKGVVFSYDDIDPIIEALQKMKEWCDENPRED